MKFLVTIESEFTDHNFILYVLRNYPKSKMTKTIYSEITSDKEMKTVLLGENVNTTI